MEAPERGPAGEKTHGDGGGFGGISPVDEGGEEDFVDGTERGEEVFFLFFHIVDEVFKVFALEIGTARELTHVVWRDGVSCVDQITIWEQF